MQIRRRGRHTTPSQVEKVAEKAGKAAPAMAIAGVLVAVPQSHQHSAAAAKPTTVTTAVVHKSATAVPAATVSETSAIKLAAKTAKNRSYDVQSGDTLSSIAQRYYHKANDWQWLYHENDKTISDPNLIYPGQKLSVPSDPPANFTLSGYTPRHAKSTPRTTTDSDTVPSHASSTSSHSSATTTSSTSLSGMLSCGGLEQLWEEAGGSSAVAETAAAIAMAESGGEQDAYNPSGASGYWQILGSVVSGDLFDPLVNAENAVAKYNAAGGFSPWVTYTDGGYAGRC